MNRRVVLYSGKLCCDCQSLKAYMDANSIEHEVRDIQENPDFAREVEERTGKLGVPYLVIDGQWVCGYQAGEPFSEEFAASLFA